MSTFNQFSFIGGMNLLLDDTRLAPNEYRVGFNVRNRFDVLDAVKGSTQPYAPSGLKQGIYSFGNYVLLFVAGRAYYQRRGTTGWQGVVGFSMSTTQPRVYASVVPVTILHYGRLGVEVDSTVTPNAGINLEQDIVAAGNLSGFLVQDGLNQPQLIYLDPTDNFVKGREVGKYSDWSYAGNRREYVPIGTFMEWVDGVLYVVAPDGEQIYRSVSGRPLDFVVNVDKDGEKGGDATTTATSVGVGGITAIKAVSNGLFVSTANSCFLLSPNRTPEAPTIFGEPTFIRQFLFNATCMSDRTFVEVLGDSAFIDPEGLRSFNAVLQQQNEGRNSVFSLKVSSLFAGLLQTSATTAAIVFDNYALFAVNTVYGYVIIVYDTLNQCFSSIDTQVPTYIKQFAKIETDVVELYAIGGDDKVYKLYSDTAALEGVVRLQSICATMTNGDAAVQNPAIENKLTNVRCVLSGFRESSTVGLDLFVNNRYVKTEPNKEIAYKTPVPAYDNQPFFNDVGSQVANLLFSVTDCAQGWKTFVVLKWTGGGSITNVQAELVDMTPMNPLRSQP